MVALFLAWLPLHSIKVAHVGEISPMWATLMLYIRHHAWNDATIVLRLSSYYIPLLIPVRDPIEWLQQVRKRDDKSRPLPHFRPCGRWAHMGAHMGMIFQFSVANETVVVFRQITRRLKTPSLLLCSFYSQWDCFFPFK